MRFSRATSFVLKYAAALGSIWLASYVRMMLDPVLGDHAPFATFYVAVMVTAWYGGLGPAVMALLSGFLAASYFFVPERGSLVIHQVPHQISLMLYLFVGVFSILISESLRNARGRAEKSTQIAEEKQDLLEREITERVRAEDARLLLAAIVESSEDAVLSAKLDGTVETWNRGAERMYGYTSDEILQRQIGVLVPPDEPNDFLSAFEKLRRGDRVDHYDAVRIRKDGELIDVSVSISPIKGYGGRVVAASVIARDITDRKLAERRRTARLAVTQTLAHANNINNIARRLLQVTCESSNSVLGAMWLVDREAGVLRCIEIWHDPDLPLARFVASCREIEFKRGEDLLGRVWAARQPAWVPDVTLDPGFKRAADAAAVGLRRSVTCPILLGNAALGVIECYSNEAEEPHVDLLEMIGTIGGQLGQFIERTRTEENLRASEHRLRLALEAGHMGTWDWNVATDRINWSPALEEIHGRTPGSFDGSIESYLSDIHPDDREKVQRTLVERLQDGHDHRIEYRLLWPDGTTHWVEGRGKLFSDEHGQPIQMSGVCIDISERKRREQAAHFLAEASTTLAALVDYESTLQRVARLAVPFFADWCAVDLIDEDGSVRQLACANVDPAKEQRSLDLHRRYLPNRACPYGTPKVLRTGQSEVLPEITAEILESVAQDAEHLQTLRRLGMRSYICVPLAVHGRTLGCITFIVAQSGRHYGAEDLALAEDLARRAAVAIENARLYAEVRQADQRKDEFLAMLAHELRNPLAPIRNALSLLGVEDNDPDTVTWARELMERQVEQLVRLVDDLLDVSRIMRGKIELRKEPVDLATLIGRAVETAQPVIDADEDILSVSLPNQQVWLEGDPIRLAQVISNLLNNASKYTDRGGHIWLEATCENQLAIIRIRDDGIGIDPDLLHRVFDLFTQADRSIERAKGGLGVGLTLVRSLVEMHGGTVQAYSNGAGQGSEFVIQLPTLKRATTMRSSDWKPTAIEPRRVLVVDDNIGAATVLAKMLSKFWGHEVETAHDGWSALEAAHAYRPDLILLDIGLPGLSGYEVAKRLRDEADFDSTLLVALTGYGNEEDRRLTQAAGFDIHLVKPASVDDLERLFFHGKMQNGRRSASSADAGVRHLD